MGSRHQLGLRLLLWVAVHLLEGEVTEAEAKELAAIRTSVAVLSRAELGRPA